MKRFHPAIKNFRVLGEVRYGHHRETGLRKRLCCASRGHQFKAQFHQASGKRDDVGLVIDTEQGPWWRRGNVTHSGRPVIAFAPSDALEHSATKGWLSGSV